MSLIQNDLTDWSVVKKFPFPFHSAVKGGQEEEEESGQGGEGEEVWTEGKNSTCPPPAGTEKEVLHSGTNSLIYVALLLL